MARVVAAFPIVKGRRSTAFNPAWVQYLNGQIWCLKEGEDFVCSTQTLKKWLTTIAEREQKFLRFVVTPRENGAEVYVQCTDDPIYAPRKRSTRKSKKAAGKLEPVTVNQPIFDMDNDEECEEEYDEDLE
ncbi:MAG: hypothetical protein KatS3mg087_1137 [Patescibacteria group bacterium]|nr:MAG: hypothetical protein KatS3mg087_1137 [Patescibacteria group bacterium]